MFATITDNEKKCKGLKEEQKNILKSVGVDSLINKVTQKEGEYERSPGYSK